jgi:hypothetical protein
MPEPIDMELNTYMPPHEPVSKAQFQNPFQQCYKKITTFQIAKAMP